MNAKDERRLGKYLSKDGAAPKPGGVVPWPATPPATRRAAAPREGKTKAAWVAKPAAKPKPAAKAASPARPRLVRAAPPKLPRAAPELPPGVFLRNPKTVPPDETPAQRAHAEAEAMRRNRARKHHNIICYDAEGSAYQSLAEARIHLDFAAHHKAGYISKPERGKYRFEHGGVLIGTYTSDFDFECRAPFTYVAPGGAVAFEAGKRYVCDVKSPATVTTEYKRTRLLMLAFHGLSICELHTAPERASKGRSGLKASKAKATSKPSAPRKASKPGGAS